MPYDPDSSTTFQIATYHIGDIDEEQCEGVQNFVHVPKFPALGAKPNRRGFLSLSTPDATIGDTFGLADEDSDFNAEANSIFNQVVIVQVQDPEINGLLGTGFARPAVCCLLKKASQHSVKWYYKSYGLP